MRFDLSIQYLCDMTSLHVGNIDTQRARLEPNLELLRCKTKRGCVQVLVVGITLESLLISKGKFVVSHQERKLSSSWSAGVSFLLQDWKWLPWSIETAPGFQDGGLPCGAAGGSAFRGSRSSVLQAAKSRELDAGSFAPCPLIARIAGKYPLNSCRHVSHLAPCCIPLWPLNKVASSRRLHAREVIQT